MTATDAPDRSSAARLLIVDDEEIIVVALKEVLHREGYEVVTHTDPCQALLRLQQDTFSVVLSDQKMPGLTGLEFLAEAKRWQPDATRILITGVLSLDTVIQAINKGEIYRFIVKPWLREELLVTIKNAVQRYQLIRHNAALQAATLDMNQQLQAQIARVAEQNLQLEHLNRALEQNLQRSIELCLHTLETFCPTLGAHARRVRFLCQAMADVLRLPAQERKVLEISAWLYDIGLVGVPRPVIKRWWQQSAQLTEAEAVLIQNHPIWGQDFARFAHPLDAVGTVIRAHHERFDGAGYPDKLRGEEIPWLARLLAVAVCYAESNCDVLTTTETIKAASGSAFDPEAVRVFLRALPISKVPAREREVLLSELRPGMLLAKGIYAANGMLLIPEGQRLTQTCIEKVINHNQVSPISQALLVYC
jgi:response regulator RpfG family c-di-GMP phosphodiesterase